MRRPLGLASCLAIAVTVALSLNVVAGGEKLRRPIGIGPAGVPLQQIDPSASLGPMPWLDPIDRFVPPVEPWEQGGFGWDVEGLDDQGDPFCVTNRRPTPSCDPDGPRAFLHAGFDAAPAPDRVVRASAQGRVVIAQHSSAYVTGRSDGEGGGIVVLEHDRDGDPSTVDDRLLTVYGHVDPEVSVGQIVARGDRIALTSTHLGNHLHFAVRQGAFNPADVDVLRAFLPPPGTSGCVGCYSRPFRAPAFPDLWQDPEQLFTGSPFWLAIYGGVDDGANDVLETDDGFMAFGHTGNQPGTPGRSMAVRRLDRQGNLVSQRAYYASSLDTIKHVERTPDGGVIALAVSLSPTGTQVPMLVKFDAAGEPQWARQYGVEAAPGFPPVRLWWEDLAVTADGGYIVTGSAAVSVVVARLDATGNVVWVRTYDPPFSQGADGESIAPSPDGGFVILAQYRYNPTYFVDELLVFHIDAAGEFLWGNLLGNGLNDARAGQIEATPDGGSVVVGYRTLRSIAFPEVWAAKLNGDGTIAWSSLYGNALSSQVEEIGTRIALTSDGGYLLAGYRWDFTHGYAPRELFAIRLDHAGEIVGQRRLDSLGFRTTPLGLRTTADGFLVAAGFQTDCRECSFPTEGDARFLVAHLDDNLQCQGLCTAPYDFLRSPGPSGGGPVVLRVGVKSATWADAPLARVDTTGQRHLCGHGFFGAPPVFQSVFFSSGLNSFPCDRTDYIEAYVCDAGGVPGAQATSPVILDVTYDLMVVMPHVVDGDSMPGQNDVVSVTASFTYNNVPTDPLSAIPLLDDGSLTIRPGPTIPFCGDDPVTGVCSCVAQTPQVVSGDEVPGDDIYTLATSLTVPPEYALGKGCIAERTHWSTLLFDTGIPLQVILKATDRIGNVVSKTETVTPSPATMSCSGDACGCCLLLNPNALQCSGLPGMPSPDFPAGVCHAF